MNVLICSDSHMRLDYFQKVMELEKPEMVIFAGDHSTDAIDMSLVYREIPFKIVREIQTTLTMIRRTVKYFSWERRSSI